MLKCSLVVTMHFLQPAVADATPISCHDLKSMDRKICVRNDIHDRSEGPLMS